MRLTEPPELIQSVHSEQHPLTFPPSGPRQTQFRSLFLRYNQQIPELFIQANRIYRRERVHRFQSICRVYNHNLFLSLHKQMHRRKVGFNEIYT